MMKKSELTKAINTEARYTRIHLKRAKALATKHNAAISDRKKWRLASYYDMQDTLTTAEYAAWEKAWEITRTKEGNEVKMMMFDNACQVLGITGVTTKPAYETLFSR